VIEYIANANNLLLQKQEKVTWKKELFSDIKTLFLFKTPISLMGINSKDSRWRRSQQYKLR
jgi:hypothetical protein